MNCGTRLNIQMNEDYMVLIRRTDIKRCTLCDILKSVDKFYFSDGQHKYRKSRCKKCDIKRKTKLQQDNNEHYRLRHREWRDNNREKFRASCSKNSSIHYSKARWEAIEVISKGIISCCKCGFDDIRALQIDHINGGGLKHFKSHTSVGYYKSMLDEPEKYQLLCANCNWIKRYENKERCSKYVDVS